MNKYLLILLCLGLLFLSACSEKAEDPLGASQSELPISWYSGYKMPELLEQKVTINDIDDIGALSEKKWYAEFSVFHLDDPEKAFSVASCKQFHDLGHTALNTSRELDNTAFMEMAVMCHATRQIVNARPASQTYLNNISFDANLPAALPKQFAMMLSRSESEKAEKDQKIKYWAQLNKITAVSVSGPHMATYKSEAGEQELELLARGDFNHDGVEDMLITSRDSVTDGSYSAIRLFKLTKLSDKGEVVLLE